MESTFALTGFSLLKGLVNDNNILAIFIALVIAFFLLGILIGLRAGSSKSNNRREKVSAAPVDLRNSRQANTMLQDNQGNADKQNYNSNHRHTHSRHRHHKRNSVYTL